MDDLLLPTAGTPEQLERRIRNWAARRLSALAPTRGIVNAQRWLETALAHDAERALEVLSTTEVLECLLADEAPETIALRRPPPRPVEVLGPPWPPLSAHVRRVGGLAGLGVARSAAPKDLVVAAIEARVRLVHAMEPLVTAQGRVRSSGQLELGRALARCTALAYIANVSGEGHEAAAAAVRDLSIGAAPTLAGEAHWRALLAATTHDARPRLLCVDLDFDDFVYSEAVSRALVREAAAAGWAVDWVRPHPADRLRLEAELGVLPEVEFAGTEWWLRDVSELRALEHLTRSATAVFANVRAPEFVWLAAATPDLPWVVWARHLDWTLRDRGYPPVPLPHLHMWVMASPATSPLERYTPHVHHQFWPMEVERLYRQRSTVRGRVFAGGDSGRDHGLLLAAVEGTGLNVLLVRSEPGDPHPNVTYAVRLPLIGFCDAIAEAEIVVIPLADAKRTIGLTVLALAMLMGRPVVATRNVYIEHYPTDGEEVVLVPEGDASALREALLDLHADQPKRERLGRAARERALRSAMFATWRRRCWLPLTRSWLGVTGADAEAGAEATAPRRVGGRHARGDGGRGALARGVLALAHVFILLHLEHSNGGHMSKTTTMTVRISGALSEFVAASVGENGAYENISEYVRDLIRRDKERTEREAFDRLKAELTRAFAASEESYRPLTAAEVIARNRG